MFHACSGHESPCKLLSLTLERAENSVSNDTGTTAGRKPLWSYADGLHETCSLPTLRRGHVFNVRRTSASTGLSMPTPIFAQETL